MELSDFYMRHKGETCLFVGVGPNLHLTPPEWFDYPSFGVNTIYRYEGWKPTYFVGVDHRLEVEDGAAIAEKYADIPKFIPQPDRNDWQGKNFYRFYHRPGDFWVGGWNPDHPDALTRRGISYYRIMGAVFQIAYFMGFSRVLLIGVQHKPKSDDEPNAPIEHFWGADKKANPDQPFEHWFIEYKHWASSNLAEVLNISEDTYVPDDVIPRGDWRDWANVKELAK